MRHAVLVDGLNLLGGLRLYHRREKNLAPTLRGFRSYFGTVDIARFFVELPSATTRHKTQLAVAKSEGFDVRIAERSVESLMITEMIEVSRDHTHIILVSGDGEFAPAVHALVGRGTRVTVVSALPGLSPKLASVATSVVDVIEVLSAGERPDVVRLRHVEVSPDDAAFIRAIGPSEIRTLRAVTAGIRLERHLADLCKQRNLPVSSGGGISRMNDLLLKFAAYGKVQHRKVALWGAIRNEAAHPGEREFSPEDLRQMEAGVEEFIRETTT